jgi:hypothetical protein
LSQGFQEVNKWVMQFSRTTAFYTEGIRRAKALRTVPIVLKGQHRGQNSRNSRRSDQRGSRRRKSSPKRCIRYSSGLLC